MWLVGDCGLFPADRNGGAGGVINAAGKAVFAVFCNRLKLCGLDRNVIKGDVCAFRGNAHKGGTDTHKIEPGDIIVAALADQISAIPGFLVIETFDLGIEHGLGALDGFDRDFEIDRLDIGKEIIAANMADKPVILTKHLAQDILEQKDRAVPWRNP